MSCIRFSTDAQRAQLARMAPRMLSSEELAAAHPAPPVTESKLLRLRLLAQDANPKIRESAASSPHTPADVVEHLAEDPEAGVRACVAKNEATPCDVLRRLAEDRAEAVRAWVAINRFVPTDVIERLAVDPSATVRGLVRWRAELVATEAALV